LRLPEYWRITLEASATIQLRLRQPPRIISPVPPGLNAGSWRQLACTSDPA
jgi:hypothetical protein